MVARAWKRNRSDAVLFLALFALFTLFNFNHLANPPYWDEILGLHNQALYLAGSNFDFASLYRPEQSFLSGGSCVYPIGALPLVYGVLYSLLPPLAVHVTGHLINLAALAFAGTLLLRLLRRFCSLKLTLLWGAVAFTEPVLSGRMAAQDQEAVLAMLMMWSIYHFFRNHPRRAILLGLAGCFIKLTGIVLPLAYGVWFLYSGVIRKKRRDLIFAAVSFALAALFYGINSIAAVGPNEGDSGIFNLGFWLLRYQFTFLLPWIGVKTLLALACFAFLFCRRRKAGRVLLLPILICGFYAAYFLYDSPQLVRYFSIILLPLGLLTAYGMRLLRENAAGLIALVFLALQLLNQNGALLPELPAHYAAAPCQLERSREFLQIVDMDRQAIRRIAAQYPHTPIVCKWPHAQMLTMPELRYVTRPPGYVRTVGTPPRYAPAPAAELWEMPDDTVYLYAANTLDPVYRPSLFPPPYARIILREDVRPERPGLILFTGVRY